jgi:dTDP-4-dehydrorhamnose reductase
MENFALKIVVTGAQGQLGTEIFRQLAGSVIPLSRNDLDITDAAAVRTTLRQLRPRFLINCAAYNRVDQAEQEPQVCQAVNARAVGFLAETSAELDCALVQISTNYVFGGNADPGRAYLEDDPPAPQGIYAQSKLEGERAAARNPKHLIVRTCGLYARPEDGRARNFVKTMLQLGAGGQPIQVVGDQCCTPSYVPHVAQAVMFLAGVWDGQDALPVPWGIYHVTNGGHTTWYDFAAEIFRLAKIKVQLHRITTAEYNAPAPRPAYSVLDTSAYHRLGGPVMPNWKTALAEYFDH